MTIGPSSCPAAENNSVLPCRVDKHSDLLATRAVAIAKPTAYQGIRNAMTAGIPQHRIGKDGADAHLGLVTVSREKIVSVIAPDPARWWVLPFPEIVSALVSLL